MKWSHNPARSITSRRELPISGVLPVASSAGLWIGAAMLCFVAACGNDRQRSTVTPRSSDDAASHGVLIVDATSEFIAQGCQKMVVWDDAAEAYYRTRPRADAYCQLDVGEKAIPFFERARRERGLPPGSYGGHRRTLQRLSDDLQERRDEAKRLKESIERTEAEMERDPVLKTAHESVDYLFQYGIEGVACAKDFSRLESCPRGGFSSPVSRSACLAYLQRGGYADPCPALGSRR